MVSLCIYILSLGVVVSLYIYFITRGSGFFTYLYFIVIGIGFSLSLRVVVSLYCIFIFHHYQYWVLVCIYSSGLVSLIYLYFIYSPAFRRWTFWRRRWWRRRRNGAKQHASWGLGMQQLPVPQLCISRSVLQMQ